MRAGFRKKIGVEEEEIDNAAEIKFPVKVFSVKRKQPGQELIKHGIFI